MTCEKVGRHAEVCSCLVHLSCPVHGSPSHQRLASSQGPVPVIPRGALLPNVTTFTRPPPLCLPHLYNYMVLHLYKLTGCSGRNTHKSAVRPLSRVASRRKNAFSPRWTASRMCVSSERRRPTRGLDHQVGA